MTNVPSKSELRAPTLPAASPRRDAALPLMFGLFCLGVIMLGLGMFLYSTGRSASDAPSAISLQKESATLPGEIRQWLAQPASKGKSQPVAGEVRQPRPLQQPTATAEGVDMDSCGNAVQPLISQVGEYAATPPLAPPPPVRQAALVASPAKHWPVPTWTEAQLVAQLKRVPLAGLSKPLEAKINQRAQEEWLKFGAAGDPRASLLTLRSDAQIASLALAPVEHSVLEPGSSEELAFHSERLRSLLSECLVDNKTAWLGRPRIELQAELARVALKRDKPVQVKTANSLNQLHISTKKGDWRSEAAVPTLNQVLMAEDSDCRLLLIELLAEIHGPRSTRALAQRAVFDPTPKVRMAAQRALVGRAVEIPREVALAGLRHPWLPANYHAAELLIALQDLDSIPQLESLLAEPDPREPQRAGDGQTGPYVMKELVRVNHTKNCMLCHAPSLDEKDPVRTAMPVKYLGRDVAVHRSFVSLQRQMPVASEVVGERPAGYYGLPALAYTYRQVNMVPIETEKVVEATPTVLYSELKVKFGRASTFVRGDVTYFKQDLSLRLFSPLGLYPDHERFDFMVQHRPLSDEEYGKRLIDRSTAPIRRHEAVLYALAQLTAGPGQEVAQRPLSYQPEARRSNTEGLAAR